MVCRFSIEMATLFRYKTDRLTKFHTTWAAELTILQTIHSLSVRLCHTRSLGQYACTFCMFFKVASNFYYNFLKLSCEIISLLYSTFINLLEKFIQKLTAISGRQVLQVWSCIRSIFECIWEVINFPAILLQNSFCHVINSKLPRHI